MEQLATQLFIGLSIGAVLLMVAVGLSVTFGQMNVINMAHGEFIMIGAYSAYVTQAVLGEDLAGWSFLTALPVAFVAAGVIGVLVEHLLIRRLHGRVLDTLLATWGVAIILQQVARDIFGAPNVQLMRPEALQGGITLAGVNMPFTRLTILGLAVGVGVLLALMIDRLPHGRRMRAVLQNRDLAEARGVNTSRVDRVTFFVGSGLAGLAGVAVTLLGPVGPSVGTLYLVDAFLVVIVGGLGHLRGAVVAAFALGVLNTFVEFSTSATLARAAVFAAAVVFLQFRPQGVFALKTRALT